MAFREIMVSYTAVDDRVHAAVLHELLLRRTPTVEQLARVTGLPAIAVDDAMARLKEGGAVVKVYQRFRPNNEVSAGIAVR